MKHSDCTFISSDSSLRVQYTVFKKQPEPIFLVIMLFKITKIICFSVTRFSHMNKLYKNTQAKILAKIKNKLR